MGEKRMLQKERKSPSQKKQETAPAKPEPRPYFSIPTLFHDKSYARSRSGMGVITKSWFPSSACRDRIHHQTPRPQQLVQTNVSPEQRGFLVFSGKVIDPFSCGRKNEQSAAEFINAITFQGKRYAISLQGCLALSVGRTPSYWKSKWGQCTGFSLDYDEVTALGRHRVVPHCNLSKHFREYLLQYDGDIYLVFLLSRASINVVDGVEVHRLDTSRLAWEKVDRLKGDAVFFVQDKRCMGISARELGWNSKGMMSNCVYFTHNRAHGFWFVYHMDTSCISPVPDSLF